MESHGFCRREPGLGLFLGTVCYVSTIFIAPFECSIAPQPLLGGHRCCFQALLVRFTNRRRRSPVLLGIFFAFRCSRTVCMIFTDTFRQLGPRIWLVVGARLFGLATHPRCAPAQFVSRNPPASLSRITFLALYSRRTVGPPTCALLESTTVLGHVALRRAWLHYPPFPAALSP
ncbi:hypothetical protein AG1IA_02299 [Rhizoctonia solani AG-1 IA]|uniref:Uncharacterized protein n=1 Tax=Thanatephorus cucumeris (strain AG1-IA) TaxID=983506 RepID=L8X022_THACA|nr:hypothetical protein AG1IA_02299 [Rhizoctonia solani AG-1 IA]